MTKDIESQQVVIEEKNVVKFKIAETFSDKIKASIVFLFCHIAMLMAQGGVIFGFIRHVDESTSWDLVLLASFFQIYLICSFIRLNQIVAEGIEEEGNNIGTVIRIFAIGLRIFYLLLAGTGMCSQIYIILKFIFFR
ncbi:hypothetical protein CASFOL_020348 [Castilleja foliolosa]|uniref:Uncharacterized protein n=1 Tax=Castilleja foliolosa TaxID=1961234 RepID=A0ABD3D456_9LAMI